MRQIQILLCAALWCGAASGQNCDFKEYKAIDGLKAQMSGGALEIAWQGDRDQQLRVSFTISNGPPTVHELAARKVQGSCIVLGRDLTPELEVTSGVRRMSDQQGGPRERPKIA